MAEDELELAPIWLCDQDLLNGPNSKELPPEWALHRFWALSKCQFGETVGEAMWCAFLCHLLPCEDKLAAIQMAIGQIWDLIYYYHLDLANTVPIQVKPPHLNPKEEAWIDVHLDKLVAKRVIGLILQGE